MMKHVLSVIFFLIVQIVFLSAPQAQDLNDLRIHHNLEVPLYPHEYDFIYRFSSKLLHATPASITTDQKNLEMSELALFLKYIYVKIDDVLELASAYPVKTAEQQLELDFSAMK